MRYARITKAGEHGISYVLGLELEQQRSSQNTVACMFLGERSFVFQTDRLKLWATDESAWCVHCCTDDVIPELLSPFFSVMHSH